MAHYRIHLRSFAPWREFGALTQNRTLHLPVAPRPPMMPGLGPASAPVRFGGHFHGDGRGFSLETNNPMVTARVNYWTEVNLTTSTPGNSRAWCDESRGPWMGVGPHDRRTGTPKVQRTVSRQGNTLRVVVAYAVPNPLVAGAPDIDATGEYSLTPSAGMLQIDAIITGDQFPACESFLEDSRGAKIFLGGFAPVNREQIMRLSGSMNKPKKIWFQSHLVVTVDTQGNFQQVLGGGSGTNASGPASQSGPALSVAQWNARIMHSIPIPSDAKL